MRTIEHYLFKQLAFVRGQTLKLMDGVTEETADRIPDGFRNNIRWQLGHIYVVLERFAFQYVGLPLRLPEGFKEQFEYGTTPLNWPNSAAVPTLQELENLLKDQQERIRDVLGHRLEEKIVPPYTTSAGMTLETPEQFLSFNLYHEGMHISVIKLYKILLRDS
ncbi:MULTISPECIES: DinB family protein [unclassified Paenibacillus]|uniref:DinB family protein n=1 Tax=unclassified Paenibacillus TaxID=185978 RepID=UPI002782584B|nr:MULTISPECIES: DinB family protein [unclassified Paenibacillus]MDQ0898622.1 putative damage-inducible protein DinB [Paenibacillus sp. V4I7]